MVQSRSNHKNLEPLIFLVFLKGLGLKTMIRPYPPCSYFSRRKPIFIKFRQPLTLQVASFVKCLGVIL